ncbi:MAG: hypothetical protein RLY93_10555 [Sumerlaeia bacterium]
MPPTPPRLPQIALIYGNDEAAVARERYGLERAHLPHGEESGDVVDIRGAGTQRLELKKCVQEIIGELGTVSMLGDAKRVVTVHDLADFRTAQKSKRASKSTKTDEFDLLGNYLRDVLPTTDNAIIFVVNENDEKRDRSLEKSSRMYDLVSRLGQVIERRVKRLDYQLEEALFKRDLVKSLHLLREWFDRSGSSSGRIVGFFNTFIQLLLQARLQLEAQQAGLDARNLFASDMRPSIKSVPSFKYDALRGFASQTSMEQLRRALELAHETQRHAFPSGAMPVVQDPQDLLEQLIVELLAPAQAMAR